MTDGAVSKYRVAPAFAVHVAFSQRVDSPALAKHEVLALSALPNDVNWKVVRHALEIDLTPYVAEALVRARDVSRADALVSDTPDIMGGITVFAGTRVPIDIVLSSLDAGIGMDRLCASYPFLTDMHIRAAEVYLNVQGLINSIPQPS